MVCRSLTPWISHRNMVRARLPLFLAMLRSEAAENPDLAQAALTAFAVSRRRSASGRCAPCPSGGGAAG